MRFIIEAIAILAVTTPVHLMAFDPGEDRPALEESIRISDEEVPLLTAGTRKKLWVDVYQCGIYARQDKTLTSYDTSAPLAITFLVRTDLLPDVPPQQWQASLAESITTNKYEVLADSFAQLDYGEQLMFVHEPGTGTLVKVDGEALFSVKHDDLVETVLRMLVGRDPVSADLKEQLLDKSS